ncbi:MAG: hypothetical protein H7Z15_19430 [Rhizobacter sp.]|nr:hypothetical protein [Rhizobacter sp.]
MATAASAAEGPRTYAVISLIGDKMSVVTYQMSTGSNIDRNRRETIDMTDGLFDRIALSTIEKALNAQPDKPRSQLFELASPSLFTRQDRFFSDGKLVLPEAIHSALKADGATHLLLVTKFRAEARMQADGAKVGSGVVEGLGFYIDNVTEMLNVKTRRQSTGFLAPFAFMRLSLVDLGSSAVLRQKSIEASTMTSTANKEAYNPWDTLSPADKIERLRYLVDTELTKGVASLLAP